MRITKTSSGFTLLELMFVVAIMGLLVIGMVPNLQNYSIKTKVKTSANVLQSHLQELKAWATAVREGTEIPFTQYNHQLMFYAIHLEVNTSNYVLWEVWGDPEDNLASFENTPNSRKKSFSFSDLVTISDITPNQTDPNIADIYYTIPTGYLDTSLTTLDTDNKIEITLSLQDETQTIMVWQNGIVDKN